MKTELKKRISAVDALRGFAVMGIMLLHNIEHFNFYSFPEASSAWLKSLDGALWDMLFFFFSGKAYAIFALLFGFTFFLQNNSAERRGIDFRNRYLWRLLLLLGFGFINACFFPGEILVLYALLGAILLPVRNLSNKAVMWIALFLMLQPFEWGKAIYAIFNPEYQPQQMVYSLGDVYPQLRGDSLWEMIKANFVTGQLASLNWAWCYGRVFQTSSLFMCGMLLGRYGLFNSDSSDANDTGRLFWQRMLCISLPIAGIMYYAKSFVFSQIENPFLLSTMRTILNSWYNLFFMIVLVSAFLLLYWANNGRMQQVLAPYGRMSMTDYVMQSIIGSFLYFGYGLGLHQTCGVTYSLLIGIVFLILQIIFAHLWFRYFQRGPLEALWHKLTWIGSKK